ncbi:MAG TPA: DUF433 domain-containing protein [Chitinophagaceae bacterium]|jgi:uncharacterized protein (DUF433 family)|nr:DUF433 domain-containing protein [Chitinophagaceae bacterium]
MLLLVKRKPALGIGLYSVPDVARILNLELPFVRRWLNEYWEGRFKRGKKVHTTWGKGREKTVHFYTLIEFYVFYQLRKQGLSAQSIAKAHEIIADELKNPFPFATSTILTDGKKILYKINEDIIINADKSRQLNFSTIIKEFCRQMDFGKDHLAIRYWPLGKTKNIVVDPHHQLGQPTIKNTNILAETLYRMNTAGETVNFISSLYDVTDNDVRDSIEFFKKAA